MADSLISEVEQNPEVAIVGSKLLYPDGSIQHAGVVFSRNDLMPYHLYKNAPENHPVVNCRREFQAVTAACMLVRREPFEAVGGFDEAYQNGFEDVDLCLKIGERKGKIVYQPMSVLYHLEEQTPGRKAHDRENGRRFLEKWGTKWLVDEDLIAFSDGCAIHYYHENGWARNRLHSFKDSSEKARWSRPAQVQRLLRDNTCQRFEVGEGSEANTELRSILTDVQNWPEDVEVLRWAANLCQRLNFQELSPGFWRKLLDIQEDREARIELAKYLLAKGELDEVDLHATTLLTSNPTDINGLLIKGVLAMQRQSYQVAFHAFQECLQFGGDNRKARMGLGMAYMGMENLQQAWEAFQYVLKDNPDDTEAIHWLIRAGTALSNWDGLSPVLLKFLERNPTDCDVRFALAGVEVRRDRIEEARRHYETIRLLSPEYKGLEALAEYLQPYEASTSRLAVGNMV